MVEDYSNLCKLLRGIDTYGYESAIANEAADAIWLLSQQVLEAEKDLAAAYKVINHQREQYDELQSKVGK